MLAEPDRCRSLTDPVELRRPCWRQAVGRRPGASPVSTRRRYRVLSSAEPRTREPNLTVRRVDLNLFRVFEAIMRQGSVAGASRELNITPSAASHALVRLRQLLDDPLFVLTDDGTTPTPRAIELAPTVNEGLRRFADAIQSRPFGPARTARPFNIAMSDYAAATLLPAVVDAVSASGPTVNLRVFPLSRTDLVEHLDNGRAVNLCEPSALLIGR